MLRRGLCVRLAAPKAGSMPRASTRSARPAAATESHVGKPPFPPKPEVNKDPRVVDNPPPDGKFWHVGIWTLIKRHGPALAAYYFILNESCVLGITYLLHYDYLGTGDIMALLKKIGAERLLDIDSVSGKSTNIGPVTVSAKFIMNFGIASSFMSLFTGFQMPFCIATLPMVQRGLSRLRPRWPGSKKKAAEAAAAAEAATASAPKRVATVTVKKNGTTSTTTTTTATGASVGATGTTSAGGGAGPQ
mmetsp:Transcript_34158/g.105576  ORF Transcript_34158/g.105576 Transcript_34158/m.105576 type:complete len:247 (-) Transcript_34158:52-792(-)